MVDLSIITVTHKRTALLLKKLETLSSQTLELSRFELVLCISGCPETYKALTDIEVAFKLTVLNFEENIGQSRGRNACAKKASGHLLYLSDDDVLLFEDTLERHLQFHEAKEQDCIAIGGADFETQTDIERYRPMLAHYWNLQGMNSSLPTSLFEAAGGFPDWLNSYGHEDVLLGYRLHKRGYPFHVIDAPVRHIGANPMRGTQPDKAKSAGKNAVQITAVHPELAYRLGVHPLLLGLKRLALSPPLSYLWKRLNTDSYTYERAYLTGALEALKEKP